MFDGLLEAASTVISSIAAGAEMGSFGVVNENDDFILYASAGAEIVDVNGVSDSEVNRC